MPFGLRVIVGSLFALIGLGLVGAVWGVLGPSAKAFVSLF
jgi:hypothetical protein